MECENNNLISYQFQNKKLQFAKYTLQDAINEFEELKNIALSCFDKNGNPNISMALRAVENKAKIAGLYYQNKPEITNVVSMNEITIDGQQLKLDIGDDYLK